MAACILSLGWHSMTSTVSFTPGRFTHKPTMPSGQLPAMSGRIDQKFPETGLQQLCGFHLSCSRIRPRDRSFVWVAQATISRLPSACSWLVATYKRRISTAKGF